MKWISANWERVLFSLIGFALLVWCGKLLYAEKTTEAAAVFGLGFLSFIYANLSRFKRFKGLGFEGELWEDKQKEAASLIERLRAVVSIYSREILLEKVKAGRWGGDGKEWRDRWQLFDELTAQHKELGQKIDFSAIKQEMDDYFLFDICIVLQPTITEAISKGKSQAHNTFTEATPPENRKSPEFHDRIQHIKAIPHSVDDMMKRSRSGTLAGDMLDIIDGAKRELAQFGIELSMPEKTLDRLKYLKEVYRKRPVVVTEELIAWSARE